MSEQPVPTLHGGHRFVLATTPSRGGPVHCRGTFLAEGVHFLSVYFFSVYIRPNPGIRRPDLQFLEPARVSFLLGRSEKEEGFQKLW
jgi:hypothetical protein